MCAYACVSQMCVMYILAICVYVCVERGGQTYCKYKYCHTVNLA